MSQRTGRHVGPGALTRPRAAGGRSCPTTPRDTADHPTGTLPDPVIFVDGAPIREVVGDTMTAAQILAAAGHDADAVALDAEGHRGQRIAAEEAVTVQDGSRFVTAPK